MLFDLRGKRKRVVQVSYVLLAAIFLVGFIGLGIGGGGNSAGGIFDAIGLGGNGSGGSLSGQYDDQIENANEQLANDPKDTAALLKLSKYEFYKAKYGISTDPNTGADDAKSRIPNASVGVRVVKRQRIVSDEPHGRPHDERSAPNLCEQMRSKR